MNNGQPVPNILYQDGKTRRHYIKKERFYMTKEKAMEIMKLKGVYLTKEGRQLLEKLINTDNKLVTSNV